MKQQKDKSTKNQKYLAIFLAATMVLSVFVALTNNGSNSNDNNISTPEVKDNSTISFSQVPGKQVHHQFNSITDGLNMSPEGVTSAIYVDLQKATGTPVESIFGNITMMRSIYGSDVTKRYSTTYTNGGGFELHQIPEQKILMPWGAAPYDGYNLLARTNNTYDIWNVVGSPVILGPRQSVEKVIDVLEGNATSTSEFNQILSQADPANVLFQEVTTKTNKTEIPADQYYMDLKKLDDGSYSQTSIFLNVKPEMAENITTYKANSSDRGVTYNVTTSGNLTKLEMTSDFAALYNETKLLSL
ncbi:MAG: hypothetical protein ACP5N0_05035 [Methanosarcina sp.]|uniref:hypothetical protein n=1 Tax=Methanosarcina sp. TaxID=2213 RepID=UPI003BB7D889